MASKETFAIRTPHAAVKIWNYVDRMTAEGASTGKKGLLANQVDEVIISTLSCSLIQTVKAKASPVGTFNFVLAPTRNWTAVITPGSWCAVMMSNEPITKKDFERANPKLIKMVGKIESVRTQVTTNEEGARVTQFLVSGQDWGHIFNDTVYVDPNLGDEKDDKGQGHTLFTQLISSIQRKGMPFLRPVKQNILTLLEILGTTIPAEGMTERLGKDSHNLKIPEQMKNFFGFSSVKIMENVELVSGALQNGKYVDVNDGIGWIDPFSLVGSHSLWQVLQDNANYVLNEMFNELVWDKKGKAKLVLFNRIKPFAYRKTPISSESAVLRSMFKYVPHNKLDDITIISVNAGTNWRDKYNFIEVKPEVAEMRVFDNWIKRKAQVWDKNSTDVFDREGFKPLIFSAKQIPFKTKEEATSSPPAPETERSMAPSTSGQSVVGFWQNKPIQLNIVKISGATKGDCWVAEKAAADTQAWFDQAKEQGLRWKVKWSFRTMEEQIALRSSLDKIAAVPGFSPHQNGRGLDIHPLDANDVALSSTTPEGEAILVKLESIGRKFGWERDVKGEGWHFTYQRWKPSSTDSISLAQASSNEEQAARASFQPAQPQLEQLITQDAEQLTPDPEALIKWCTLLQEWYFDTHRLLNGQLVMTGSSKYIAVGNNIMFDAELLGVKHNFSEAHAKTSHSKKYYILAHVETVKNNFQISESGARSFQTTIEFVRGILVDENRDLVGDGSLDSLSNVLSKSASFNDDTVIAIPSDPEE